MARLREGRANTARGGAHFLRETVGRVRYGGARGQLTVRADSGFYTPFQSEPGAAPVRLIVRRVKPTPGSQLALFATYSYHGFITGRDGRPSNWRPATAATPRSRTPFETSSTASG